MRGKVTADAYSGWWRVGVVVRVRGFAMRYDDWVVTRCCDLYGGDL